MSIEQKPTSRVHHPYSPSSLQPREACPKYCPTNVESAASLMGTWQHDAADSGEDNDRLSDWHAAAVAECMIFVAERKKVLGPCTEVKEIYLPIDDEVIQAPDGKLFRGTTAGYVDTGLISLDESIIEVVDYKFGKIAVEHAKKNLQGLSYLLGLWKKHPRARLGRVWFVLPHRDEVYGAEFELNDQFYHSTYLRIKAVVARSIEANKNPDDYSMANPTVGACLFCANIGKCPRVAEIALEIGKKYKPLEIPSSLSTTIFRDPADVAKGIQCAQVVKTWAEAYRSQATAKVIDSPNFIPEGYDLVSMSKRSIKHAKRLGELAKTFIPAEQHEKIEGLYDIALGPLEELISAAAPRGQKEKTVDEFGAKAVEAGIIEEGQPFAFLRQSKKQK